MSRRAAFLFMLLALPARGQVLSPGPLVAPHAALEGDRSCGNCHSSGKRVAAELCLRCHAGLARRVRDRAGLHGRAYRGQPCEACHVDHIGSNGRLIFWPGDDMNRFDHALTGWPLEGAHERVACSGCHREKSPGGRATFLAVSPSCATCHKDPHGRRFGATCGGCHGPSSWKVASIRSFDHALARYPLRGQHARVACTACHGEPARWRGLRFEACGDCHADKHQGRFDQPCQSCHTETAWTRVEPAIRRGIRDTHSWLSLDGGHARLACAACHDRGTDEPPSKGSDCVSCHAPVHEAKLGDRCAGCHGAIRWEGLPPEVGLRVHPLTRFPLEGAHAAVACDRCHRKTFPRQRRFRNLDFGRCATCHQDPHGGGLVVPGGRDCIACHTMQGFSPTTFGVAAHRTTAFVLDGRHEAAPCTGCHPGAHPRLEFRVPRRACADCHVNRHGELFAKEMASGGCARCHTTMDWLRPAVDHSIWPLAGAHAGTPCGRCHHVAAAGDGRREVYRGLPRACAGCHEDVHAGQFRMTEPVLACDACHDAASASWKISAFDHAARAGWPLEGKHARAACAACHKSETLRNGLEAVRWRLGYRRCRDCHASPHQGPG